VAVSPARKEGRKMRYFVLIDGKAGGYGATFPDLPGCTAIGKTIDGAMANAAEVLRDWVEVAEETGEAVPAPRPLEKLRRDPEVAEALVNGASRAAVPLVRQAGKSVKANLSLDSGVPPRSTRKPPGAG
jgi:predicted RNase H-like HicB family nuclease